MLARLVSSGSFLGLPRRGRALAAVAVAVPTLILLAGTAAFADPPRPPPSPPREAFEACASLREGDTCVVKLGDVDIDGTCRTFGDVGLACRPNHMPPPPPDGEKRDPS